MKATLIFSFHHCLSCGFLSSPLSPATSTPGPGANKLFHLQPPPPTFPPSLPPSFHSHPWPETCVSLSPLANDQNQLSGSYTCEQIALERLASPSGHVRSEQRGFWESSRLTDQARMWLSGCCLAHRCKALIGVWRAPRFSAGCLMSTLIAKALTSWARLCY